MARLFERHNAEVWGRKDLRDSKDINDMSSRILGVLAVLVVLQVVSCLTYVLFAEIPRAILLAGFLLHQKRSSL